MIFTESERVLMAAVHGKRILVVEDDEDIVDLFLVVIGDEENHIDVAANGSEALEKVRKRGDYDLIISDFHMPLMDGISLQSEIHNINPLLAARMLFISGEQMDVASPNLLTLEKRRFLAKPFGIKELRQCVEDFFSESERN